MSRRGSADSSSSPRHYLVREEDVAQIPRPGLAVPTGFQFAPGDNSALAFIHAGEEVSGVFACSIGDDGSVGEIRLAVDAAEAGASAQQLSLEEKLRRERARTASSGVTSFGWMDAPTSHCSRIAVVVGGTVCVQDGVSVPPAPSSSSALATSPSSPHLRVVSYCPSSAAIDPKLSPDGELVAFVRGGELWVVSAKAGESNEVQLTTGAGNGVTNGLAEFVAQEELSRFDGYWWSPNSREIAFCQADESGVSQLKIQRPDEGHEAGHDAGPPTEEVHRYPYAGGANAKVRVGVVSIDAPGEMRWLPIDTSLHDTYLARARYLPDGSFVAQILNRPQQHLEMIRIDTASLATSVLLEEKSDTWVDVHDLFAPLPLDEKGEWPGFVWGSQRDTGFAHLFLCGRDGVVVRQLTRGDWVVESITKVDDKKHVVYFTGNRDDVREIHLYSVSLHGGDVQKITQTPGTHAVTIDPRCRFFVDVFSCISQPPRAAVFSLETGREVGALNLKQDPRVKLMNLRSPEMFSFPAKDGTMLYAALYLPPSLPSSGTPAQLPPPPPAPLPLIVSVYGGPHVQFVTNSFSLTADLRCQLLSQQGCLVLKLDNRGSHRRGRFFAGQIHKKMGSMELADQAEGVGRLVAGGWVDPLRVGMVGWSYGGYLSAMAMMTMGDVFAGAVSGAPVTDWHYYDSCYTERYMGTPQENPREYKESSVLEKVHNLRGRLLIVHGLADENVHFRHSARLISALVAAGKDHELLLLPGERHSPRAFETRVFLERKIIAFLLSVVGVSRGAK